MNEQSEFKKFVRVFPDPQRESLDAYVRTYVSYVCKYKQTNKQTRIPATTSFYPEIWSEFRKAVEHHEERGVHANHVLEGFMLWYAEAYGYKPQQVSITNFFINKPEQVNIAEKQVVIEKPKRRSVDYSKLSLDELQKLYETYSKHPKQHVGGLQVLAFELKRRGVSE